MSEKHENLKNIGYIIISNALIFDKNLNWLEKAFLSRIAHYENTNGCTASNEHFAEFLGISKDRVSKILSKFNKIGYTRSRMIYKPGTKQVDKRLIQINWHMYHNIDKNNPFGQKSDGVVDFTDTGEGDFTYTGGGDFTDTGIGENYEDSIRDISTRDNNNTTTTSNTQKAQKIFTLVQTELRTFNISPIQQGVVMEWLDTFEVDVIEEAIKRAVMNGHAYIKGADNILKKWRSVGAFTMDGVRKDDELFQQRKQQRGNNGWNNQQSNQPVAKKKYKDGDIMPGGVVYESIYDF